MGLGPDYAQMLLRAMYSGVTASSAHKTIWEFLY